MAAIRAACSRQCSFRPEAALPKALSILPIIGPMIQAFQTSIINARLGAGGLSNREVKELIQAKNHYHIIGISRELLVVASIVVLLALSVMNPIFGAITLAAMLTAVGFMAFHLHQGIQQYNNLPA